MNATHYTSNKYTTFHYTVFIYYLQFEILISKVIHRVMLSNMSETHLTWSNVLIGIFRKVIGMLVKAFRVKKFPDPL